MPTRREIWPHVVPTNRQHRVWRRRAASVALLWASLALAPACANASSSTSPSSEAVPTSTSAAKGKPRILVHGHRGARSRFPENSLVAFDHALEVGVDVLEMDLVVTKDNQLVVAHDPVLSDHVVDLAGAEAFASYRVRDLTLAQVLSLQAGTRVHPRFPEQTLGTPFPLATLDDVFELVRASSHPAAKTVGFNIETKVVPGEPELGPDAATFARLVVDVLRKHRMEKRTIIQSFDVATLDAVRALNPKITLSFLNADSRPHYVAMMREMDVEVLSPHHLWITKEDVDALHKIGRQVIPWTANTPDEWDDLIALGVDGIITDDPEALILYLEERGLR